MNSVSRRNCWIVSPRYDLFFFIGCVGFSAALYALHWVLAYRLGIEAERATGIITYSLFIGLFDFPHIIQTFSRSHLDALERERHRRRIVWGLPVFIAVGFATVLAGYHRQAIELGALYGVWHIYKQNTGFLGLYRRLNGENEPLDRWLDGILYASVVLVGALHDIHPTAERVLAGPGKVFCAVAALAVVARQVRRPNVPKILFLAATLGTYVVLFFILDLPILLFVALETAYHDIQYQGWIIQYQRRRYPESPGLWKKWLAVSHLIGVLFAPFDAYVVRGAYLQAFYLSHATAILLLYSPFYMLVIYHYYIDGVIWHFSQSPELRALLPNK